MTVVKDGFDGQRIDSALWDTLVTHKSCFVEQVNGRIEMGKNAGYGDQWVQSGLITKNAYDLSKASVAVEIVDLGPGQCFNLQITPTKAFNTDPWKESDWYVLVKQPSAPDKLCTIERRIGGGTPSGIAFGLWEKPAGELKIETRDGFILFYMDDKLKHVERYALHSYDCYIDIRHSTLSNEAGKSIFDNFNLMTA